MTVRTVKSVIDYTVTAADHDTILLVRGSTVTFGFTLPIGFTITIINVGGGQVSLVAPAQEIHSPSATLLTEIWQSTTICKIDSNEWVMTAEEPQQDYVNALDFGMRSGSTDSAPALQAAIDMAATGVLGNRVFVPAGDYTLSATIIHRANVIVFGDGPSTILRFPAGVTAWDFATGFLRAELSYLQIIGSFATPGPIGVDIDQSQRVYIHDMQIWDFQIGINLSGGGVFSGYNTIGPNVEVNRSTSIGIRALANANANKIVGTRVFYTYNGTSTAIGIDISDTEVLEIDDCQIEAADFCLRVRNTGGITRVNVHDCYLEPGTNPATLVVGSCYDIVLTNLFDGIETLYLRNNTESGSRGTIDVPPEMLCEIDGYSQAYYGARFSGAAVPKRNYVYNGQLLYYGLPSILPGWGASGSLPVLAASGTFVTGNRSLSATATGVNSTVACGFTVSDDGVDWVTCGIRYQIIAGNTGFFFSGTIGANSRQYVPAQTPTGVWREAWVNVPVDPTNRNGAVGCVIDSVGGVGQILIDEIWAIPGKYAASSTQYGERIQLLPAPVPIWTRTGIAANEAFGPIDILTLPATLAAPLDAFSTAPSGVVGCILRAFINCTGAPAGLCVAAHQVYIDIPASGTVVAASYEFLQAVYSNQFHTKDVIVRDTTISGGYNALDGFASDYNIALIGWILA